MFSMKLKLNSDKTEFILIGTRQQLTKINIPHISVGDTEIRPSSVVRNLGSWFDNTLSMEVHVSNICKSSFYYLYNLRRIRKYLSPQSASILVHAFITSRLDYCNSLLYGMPENLVIKLQRIQNAAARIVSRSSKFDHITPVLHNLHWLPVRYRIHYKILILTFKALHGSSPAYLNNLISIKETSNYNLRSNGDKMILQVPKMKSNTTTGDRSFVSAGPKLWNTLPANIRLCDSFKSYKKLLKTHLFKIAFRDLA